MIRTPMNRASDSLSIGVEHSRNGPRFLSELGFLSRRSGNVHSRRDRSGGDTRDSHNRSPRIGQIERRIADLQKERKIPRLLTVFALTFVSYTQRNSPEKSYDDDDDGTPPGRHRTPKRTKENSEKQGSPRTNGGSTESPWDEEFADVKITHFRARFLLFHRMSKVKSVPLGAPHTQHDETRGLRRPDLTERWGFSGRNPHQQKEHRKSCKMVCFSALCMLCARRTTVTQRRS